MIYINQVVKPGQEWSRFGGGALANNGEITRIFKDAKAAYLYALDMLKENKKPGDETRTAACREPKCAYFYAVHVDKTSREDTRTAACLDPKWAFWYALAVDKSPRNDTRTAACRDPKFAYLYARDVDKTARDDTRTAACQNPEFASSYASEVDRKSGCANDTIYFLQDSVFHYLAGSLGVPGKNGYGQ